VDDSLLTLPESEPESDVAESPTESVEVVASPFAVSGALCVLLLLQA
jgi:hypothetical protein